LLDAGAAGFAAGGRAGVATATFSHPRKSSTFSVVIGVISAALLSTPLAGAPARQYGNRKPRNPLRAFRCQQRISRYQALIADKNRRIVIWDGVERPELLGQLPAETGAPQMTANSSPSAAG
jgi:hypothetical protein